jgi:hypothetical protein
VLTLVNTDGSYGTHNFNLNTANLNLLGHVTSLSGPTALADGIYSVTLSYQDLGGNPAASTTSSNVRVDHVAPLLAAVAIALQRCQSALCQKWRHYLRDVYGK